MKKTTGSAMFFHEAFTAYLLKESPGRVKESDSLPQDEFVLAKKFDFIMDLPPPFAGGQPHFRL